MKLYYMPGACSLATHIVLEWTGATYETKKLGHGELKVDAYLRINPQGMVPALELDDGTVLTQNAATLGYLADTHPEAKLYGDGTEGPRRSPSLAGLSQFRPASRLQAAVRRDRLSR